MYVGTLCTCPSVHRGQQTFFLLTRNQKSGNLPTVSLELELSKSVQSRLEASPPVILSSKWIKSEGDTSQPDRVVPSSKEEKNISKK